MALEMFLQVNFCPFYRVCVCACAKLKIIHHTIQFIQMNKNYLPFATIQKAYAMDNTDVHFLNKFARIAFDQRYIDLAGTIFNRVNLIGLCISFVYDFNIFFFLSFSFYFHFIQKCLELNSNHMPSMDGILEMLCHKEDYVDAYGWAIYCHSKFPKYQHAIDVICDVYHILSDSSLLQA